MISVLLPQFGSPEFKGILVFLVGDSENTRAGGYWRLQSFPILFPRKLDHLFAQTQYPKTIVVLASVTQITRCDLPGQLEISHQTAG